MVPVPQSLLKLFTLANPKPLPHPFLPVETTVKALALISLHSLCVLADPGASLRGPQEGTSPPLQDLQGQTLVFRGPSRRKAKFSPLLRLSLFL